MALQFSLVCDTPETIDSPCVVVGVYEKGLLTDAAQRIDKATDGAIKRQIESGDIDGKPGNLTMLYAPQGIKARRVLVVGLGTAKCFDAARFRQVHRTITRALDKLPL